MPSHCRQKTIDPRLSFSLRFETPAPPIHWRGWGRLRVARNANRLGFAEAGGLSDAELLGDAHR